MHGLEHMAEETQAFDVRSTAPPLTAPVSQAPVATTAGLGVAQQEDLSSGS